MKFGYYVDFVICILIFVNYYYVNGAELCLRLSFISVCLLRMHWKRCKWELKHWMVVSQNCNYFSDSMWLPVALRLHAGIGFLLYICRGVKECHFGNYYSEKNICGTVPVKMMIINLKQIWQFTSEIILLISGTLHLLSKINKIVCFWYMVKNISASLWTGRKISWENESWKH